jgi:hypothetical protein
MNREEFDEFEKIYGQDNPSSESGGWIQWKGTEVCMDVHCKCGFTAHIDETSFYFYRCESCKRTYAVGQNIKLIELNPEQIPQDFFD